MSILDTQAKVTYNPATSEVIVRKKHNNKLRTPFSAVSSLTNKKRARQAMAPDVFDLLDNVSKGAFSVFNNLKFNRDEGNNLTKFDSEGTMSTYDKESLSRKLKELRDVGLIRNVKKQLQADFTDVNRVYVFQDPRRTFIINPDMIRCTNHDEAEYLWGQCAQEK